MEFEQEVADELFKRGYLVLYRNLSISVNKAIIGEFDIICRDFIIEVKSGKDIHSCGLYFMGNHNILPRGFVYYIYCPVIDDDTITMFNKDYSNDTFIYTNTLDTIYERHQPIIECNIDNQSNLCKILNLSLDSIKRFNKLYINYEEYTKVYISLHYVRDTISDKEKIKWSDKLDYMVDSGILVFHDEFDPSIPYVRGFFNHNKQYSMNGLEIPKLELNYSLNSFTLSPDPHDIFLDGSDAGPHRNPFYLLKKQNALLRCR
jgi:hypothetical protein